MIYKNFMSIFLLIFIIVLANADDEDVASVFDEIEISNEKPLKLTQQTFLDTISQPEIGTLVMFYAPWYFFKLENH